MLLLLKISENQCQFNLSSNHLATKLFRLWKTSIIIQIPENVNDQVLCQKTSLARFYTVADGCATVEFVSIMYKAFIRLRLTIHYIDLG